MAGRHHSEESKRKMSQAHKANQQGTNQSSSNGQKPNYVLEPMSMQDFLSNHPSVEDYIKSLAKKVVKEEVQKLIWNSKRNISIIDT